MVWGTLAMLAAGAVSSWLKGRKNKEKEPQAMQRALRGQIHGNFLEQLGLQGKKGGPSNVAQAYMNASRSVDPKLIAQLRGQSSKRQGGTPWWEAGAGSLASYYANPGAWKSSYKPPTYM